MSKFISSILLFLIPIVGFSQDTTVDTSTVVPTAALQPKVHQFRFSFDASKILSNALNDQQTVYEIGADYYGQQEIYYVAEGGFGNAAIDYPDLKYRTDNVFLRLGIDKALFVRKRPQDWGMAFIGVRYGLGIINRGSAAYTTNDGLGGITSGTLPSQRYAAHWAELTGGMRLELFKNVFAGWNIRFKFLLNQKSFEDLKPAYIAGYGPGEKGTSFDYNFYIAYAIRWTTK